MRTLTVALAVALGGAAASAAVGQDQAPSFFSPPRQTAERWTFKRVDDGFMRLDGKTGQLAHCTPINAGWTCQAVPEDRAALEKEIAHLKGEVAALEQEVAHLRAAPRPAPPRPAAGGGIMLKLPTRQDLAQAKDYLAHTWRRLVQMIDQFQKTVLRNG